MVEALARAQIDYRDSPKHSRDDRARGVQNDPGRVEVQGARSHARTLRVVCISHWSTALAMWCLDVSILMRMRKRLDEICEICADSAGMASAQEVPAIPGRLSDDLGGSRIEIMAKGRGRWLENRTHTG